MDVKKQEKRILTIFVLTIFLYTGFFLFADIKKISLVSAQFNWKVVPFLLLLTLVNYLFRFFRWYYLLKKN